MQPSRQINQILVSVSLTNFPQRKLEITFPINAKGINCNPGGNVYTHSAESGTLKELLIALLRLGEEKDSRCSGDLRQGLGQIGFEWVGGLHESRVSTVRGKRII